jgi:hypothetical protein
MGCYVTTWPVRSLRTRAPQSLQRLGKGKGPRCHAGRRTRRYLPEPRQWRATRANAQTCRQSRLCRTRRQHTAKSGERTQTVQIALICLLGIALATVGPAGRYLSLANPCPRAATPAPVRSRVADHLAAGRVLPQRERPHVFLHPNDRRTTSRPSRLSVRSTALAGR